MVGWLLLLYNLEKMCNVFKIHYVIIHVVACKVFFWYKIVVWAMDDIVSYADVLKVPMK